MSIRAEKAASLIKRIIAKSIDEIAHEHSAGMVTVTAVRLSPDLQMAKVYISIFGNKITPGKFIAILEDNKGSIRTYIGKNVRMRYTPDVRFYLDDTLDEIEHIHHLINDVKKDAKDVIVNPDDYDEKSFPKK